jgi:hypothetical protein
MRGKCNIKEVWDMNIYAVEEWRSGYLRGYKLCTSVPEAMIRARCLRLRVLNGKDWVRAIDHDGIEIPSRSMSTFLELGKPVGLVQDDTDNSIRVTVHKLGGD